LKRSMIEIKKKGKEGGASDTSGPVRRNSGKVRFQLRSKGVLVRNDMGKEKNAGPSGKETITLVPTKERDHMEDFTRETNDPKFRDDHLTKHESYSGVKTESTNSHGS